MAQLTDIPNEILLEFFSHLPLKALIAARGVNQHWRQLVSRADILPARRALLDLYLTILKSPLFIQTRPWVLSKLQPFDRQGYLDTVLNYPYFPQESKAHLHLPEEFCLWVLEWPARAAIRCSWPGLPYRSRYKYSDDNSEKILKHNCLHPTHVSPWAIEIRDISNFSYENMPVLHLWSSIGAEGPWMAKLALDKRDGVRGKVYEISSRQGSSYKMNREYMNFIGWQRRVWEMEVEEEALRCGKAAGTDM